MHHTNLTYTRKTYITSLINQFGIKEAALIADGTVEVIKNNYADLERIGRANMSFKVFPNETHLTPNLTPKKNG